MPYYLSSYIGAGTHANPCRPAGAEDRSGWAAIDRRPNKGATPDGAGRNACLLWLPTPSTDARLHKLGEDPSETPGQATLRGLASRFALAPDELLQTTLGDLLFGLLLTPAARGGATPLSVSRDGRYHLRFGPLVRSLAAVVGGLTLDEIRSDVYQARIRQLPASRRVLHEGVWYPLLTGGALPATDDFNRANADPIGGNWTTKSGFSDWAINTNVAVPTETTMCLAYWNADTPDANQYSQLEFAGATNAGEGGPATRISTSVNSYYNALFYFPGDYVEIWKTVEGTETKIADGANTTLDATDVFRFESNGSSQVAKINTVEVNSCVDTDITEAGRLGMYAYGNVSQGWDDWEGGNLGGGASSTQEGYRWRMDDGDEANATWAANQDTGITAPANTTRRLRILIDTSGDVNAAQFQLEYKEANEANWTKIR